MRYWSAVVVLGVIAVGAVGPALAQSTVNNADRPPRGGTELYGRHCASCHGEDGKGHGPKATTLSPPPTDLTTIAKNNVGVFPRATIEDVLMNGGKWKGHGSKGMPVWGPIFRSLRDEHTNPALTDEQLAIARVQNIVTYLESIQVKE